MVVTMKCNLIIAILTGVLAVVAVAGYMIQSVIQREIISVELVSSGGLAGIVSEISISKVDDSVNVKKIERWNNATRCGTVNIEEFKKLEELILTNINFWKAEYLTDARDVASDKIIIYFKDGEEKSILVYDFPSEEVPRSLLDTINITRKLGEVNGSCD
ncbi:MAG: hypothetical protein ABII74_02740 [Elusimicrobiota bacterium]